MLGYLLLSALCVNGMHGYLLWSQKHDRKWSISVHAIKSRKDYILYIAGHVLGGLFFVLFAKEFFVTTHDTAGLFYLTLATYFFEIIQAILPSKDKYEKLHSIAALIMWACFLTTGLISIVILDVSFASRVVAAALYLPILIMLVKAFSDRGKLYFYQMTMVLLFYCAMLSLVVGS